MNELYTIGHSTQEFEAFLELLRKHGIQAVADVRTSPYSKMFPWFSKDELKRRLGEQNIHYVFLGKELGARRDEPCCYIGSRADYDLIAKTPLFQEGLGRIERGLQKMRVALMCAEKDPIDCHRTILVARHAQAFSPVKHILNDGSLESHADLEVRLVVRMGRDHSDMFLSDEELLKLAYKQRGEEIAYKRDQENDEYEH